MFGGRVDRGGGREGKGKSLRKNKIALNEMAKQAAKPERAPQGTTKSHPATLLPSTHRMAFIDAGCHIVNRQFDRDQLKVLQRSQMCGAQALIAITTDFEKTEQAIDVAKQNSGFVYVSVGLHSDNVKRNNDKTISTRLEQVREFALKPEVVSLSCSIDFTRDIAIRYAQEKVVESHLDIAGELNMPIILQEIGGASEALLEQISAYRGKKWQNDPLAAAMQLLSSSDSSSSAAPVPAAAPASGTVENRRVAIYDFCGTQAELLAYLSYDCYIILSGGMCDDGAKYKQLVDILRPKGVAEDDSSWTPLLPRHRLLIATDSPFKTPQCIADLHIRESRNEPANMPEILQALAKIYRITPAEMAAQVTANSKEFFWLDERDREVVDPTAPAAAAASAPASAPSTAAPAAGGKKSATSAAAPAAEAEKGKGKGAGKAGGKKEEEEDVKGGKKGGKGGKKKKGDDEDDEEEEEIKPSKSQRKGNKKKGKHDDDFSDEDEGKGRKGRAGKKMDLSALEDEIEALGKKGKKKGKQMKKEESESEEESEEEKEVEKPQKGAVPVHVDDDEDEEDEDEHVHKSEEEEEDEEEEDKEEERVEEDSLRSSGRSRFTCPSAITQGSRISRVAFLTCSSIHTERSRKWLGSMRMVSTNCAAVSSFSILASYVASCSFTLPADLEGADNLSLI
eukprot:GILI01013804.1.p1 GENE.GILI01013804.1~~GILI01013804.1.p1  ORF type:complete len:680 (-),score=256.32 GILI01013804.1:617-2656(-)